MKQKLVLIFFALMVMASGCPKESEDLLNPPSFKETVKVRLVNFSGDYANYQLWMDDSVRTEVSNWSEVSQAISPPSDSAMLSVARNGNEVFENSRMTFFLRDLYFSVVLLPSAPGEIDQRAADTLINITNASLISENSVNAFIKMFNAYPSTTDSYSLKLGCPGGDDLTRASIGYRTYSSVFQVRAIDPVSFSLIKHSGTEQEIVDTYEAIVDPKTQYTLFVTKGQDGSEELYLLNEDNPSSDAMIKLEPSVQKETKMRVINLTSQNISMDLNGELFADNVLREFITDHYLLPACLTNGSETFTLASSGTTTTHYYSPDVSKEYSAIVLPTVHSDQDTVVFYPPAQYNQIRDGKAVIRILNASEPNLGLTVSLGANSSEVDPDNEQQAARKYSTGTSLTNRLDYMDISQSVILEAGIKPINVFTSTQPGFYLFSLLADLKEDTDYLLITYQDDNGDIQYTLIEDRTIDQPIDKVEEGVLTQIVHAWPGAQALSISIDEDRGNIVQNAEIFYENSIGTIIPQGEQTIRVLADNVSITAEENKRILMIVGGDAEPEILTFNDAPMGADYTNFKWRFINAAKDVEFLDIKSDDGRDTTEVLGGLTYGSASFPETKYNERKVSLIFEKDGEEIFVAKDINLPIAKNYSLIFAGNKEDSYTLIIQQEF